MKSVELFGGAGGLAIGAELAGFKSQAFLERDKWACDTVRQNAARGFELVRDWTVVEGDVREFDWRAFASRTAVDLVSGGPPCQPFSSGGKGRAAADDRDMFPAAATVVRELRPKAFVLENVRGLTRDAFAEYFELIRLRLAYVDAPSEQGEDWVQHLARLRKLAGGGAGQTAAKYRVAAVSVDSADYGVPQHRHRVFIIGLRSDSGGSWSMPAPTHTRDALLHDQWVSGAYWERHGVAKKRRPERDPRLTARIARLQGSERSALGLAWRTVRDAISDLPEPTEDGSGDHLNHRLQLGARTYRGHTGSPLDQPAKTLKAGGHGVAGGENMLVRTDGSVRYFSVREAARLQTFPDEYELHGAWGEAMRQIGNAVPVAVAEIVFASIREALESAEPA